MDLIQELNYVCNSDIFRIAYSMKTTLPSTEGLFLFQKVERNRVILWLRKIMSYNKTVSDLRMRNEFLRHLATLVQNGKLKQPFDLNPPKGSIKLLARTLPGHEEAESQEDESMAMLRFLPAKHGGFLLPRPLPVIGAYCYITAISPPECNKPE